MLQFIFYIGWLKVAETLLNPFGEDDDDFDIEYLIKRNKEAGYAIVDDLVVAPPELMKDPDWDNTSSELDKNNVNVSKNLDISITKEKCSTEFRYQESAYITINEDIFDNYQSVYSDRESFIEFLKRLYKTISLTCPLKSEPALASDRISMFGPSVQRKSSIRSMKNYGTQPENIIFTKAEFRNPVEA